MKATQGEFRSALAPVDRDLAVSNPSLIRFVDEPEVSSLNAWMWDSRGSGAGLVLEGGLSREHAIALLAERVQEFAVEALWAKGEPATWPLCPEHPNTHCLTPTVEQGRAVWRCPAGSAELSSIGCLPG